MAVATRVLAFAAALLLAGCTSFPTADLTAYERAFREVAGETEKLIIAYGQARARHAADGTGQQGGGGSGGGQAGQQAGGADLGFPAKLTLDTGSRAGDDTTGVRRRALQLIERYNGALSALAEGRSKQAVEGEISGVVEGVKGIAGALGGSLAIPGLDQAVSLASTLVAELQKAQNRAEFKQALADGAPLVDGLLALFAKDAEDLYEIRAAEATGRLARAQSSMRFALFDLRDLLGDHAAAPSKSLQDWEKRVSDALATAGLDRVQPELQGRMGAGTYGPLVSSQAEQLVQRIEALGQRAARVRQAQQAFAGVIRDYGRMLAQTRRALERLRAAGTAPPDVRDQARELAALAFDVKRGWAAVRAARADPGDSR